MKTVVSVYSVTMGVAILVLWSVCWAIGAIPDMMTKPWEIAMHLTAEFTTALLLIVSGVALWLNARWATRVNVFATGMLVYSLILSPGYYLEKNAMIFVLMFAVVFLLTVVLSPAFKPVPKVVLVDGVSERKPFAKAANCANDKLAVRSRIAGSNRE